MHIINPADIAAFRATGDTVFIDARGGADAYDRFTNGHLEGALFVNLETDISEKGDDVAQGGRHPLPTPQAFGKLLGFLGIMPSTTVVVYDDKRGANAAARFWWMMKAAGHESVYVVNGGLEAIIEAGLPVDTDELTLLSEFPSYPIVNWELPLVNIEQVAKVAGNEGYTVIDVRENYRYQGESEPIDLVAGHIPGAVNIPYTGNLNERGDFLSAQELADKYREVIEGKDPAKIIVHCGSGVTACHTLLALAEAGFPGSALYVGSWSEWSRNDLPVATGNN
jgi:thiosulfate/3-mercaptopyruvate sulfurtransferase